MSDGPKKPGADARLKKAAVPAKDRTLSNEELDKVSGGKGSAPVKLPFEVED